MSFKWAALIALVFCLGMAGQDVKQRVKAVRELAKQGSNAIPKITPSLKDRDLDVRIEAVKALVEIGGQHSLDPLIQATHDNDSEVQIRATDGLVNFYVPGYVKSGFGSSIRRAGASVKGRFSDNNDQVIDQYIQVRPEVVQALGALVRGGSSMESRANAARAVGILRGSADSPDLLQALRSKDSRLMYESLIALQKIRDPKTAPGTAFLMRDLDEKVQVTTIETIGLLQNKASLPDLRDVLARSRSMKVRRAALTAIAMLPDPASKEIYARSVNDRDEGLRQAAAEGYARLADPSTLHLLEQTFTAETKTSPRLAQAFALVMMGKTEMTELGPFQFLINGLNSSFHKGEARSYLIELARKPELRREMYPALSRSGKEERIQLAQILAVSGGQDTVPYLDSMTKDADSDVASEGLRALRILKARLP